MIFVDTTRGYGTGHGDLIMSSWLPDIVYHATGSKAALLKMFGHEPRSNGGEGHFHKCWEADLKHCHEQPRLKIWADTLGIDYAKARRPQAIIPEESKIWAEENIPAGCVLLFPQCAWLPRAWQPAYWIDLHEELIKSNHNNLVVTNGRDERFKCTRQIWGQPWPNIAAAIQRASLVVGNDSGPAHLAGTLGTPTLVLSGPTSPNVFGHLPEVEVLQGNYPCVGCHFSREKGFRSACGQSCLALLQLDCRTVIQKLRQKLEFVEATAKTIVLAS